ncbi:MAG: hypothetical protein MI700_05325 [Balneolales bacterium]|nr:hypothetical protein [Balneolales bacterium]
MVITSLHDIYLQVQPKVQRVFVVPLIRFDFKETDYLYLLYKPILEHHSEIKIHSISALGHFRFVLAQLLGQKSVLHYHWLEFQDVKSLLGMPYKLLCIGVYCLLGGKMVWTVHNLQPHNRKYLSLHKTIHSWMARKSINVLVHSNTAQEQVSRFLDVSESKIFVHPHPPFPAKNISRAEALQKLENEILANSINHKYPIFLMIGTISTYKNIPEVLEVLEDVSGNYSFVVAGYVKKGQAKLSEFLQSKSHSLEWFHYIPGFIPEDFYAVLLSASDVCVFNYTQILTSGGIEMAKAYNRTIFAPNISTITELRNHDKIKLFDSRKELKKLVRDFSNSYTNG